MRLLAHDLSDMEALKRSTSVGAKELVSAMSRSQFPELFAGMSCYHDDGGQAPLARYWISPEVVDMVREVGVTAVGWPSPLPERGWWAECEMLMMRCGALFSDRNPDGSCDVIFITYDRVTDLWNNGVCIARNTLPYREHIELKHTALREDSEGFILRGILSIIHVFLAARKLMDEPRILEREETPPPREVRRAAEKARRAVPAPVEYVTIHVSKREREARERIAAEEARTGKVFHKVRTHLRVRETGRVERVREHWRGDPGKGRKDAAFYRVVR